MDRRGSVYAWIVVVVSLVLLGLVVPLFWYIYCMTNSTFTNIFQSQNYTMPQEAQQTYDLLGKVWWILPFVIIIGLFLWAIVYSVKREPWARW